MKLSPLLLFTALVTPSLATLDYKGIETHRVVYDGGLYTSYNFINPEDHTYVNILPLIGGPKRVNNTDLITKIGMPSTTSTTSTSASSSTATPALVALLLGGESSEDEEDERAVVASSASVVTPAARVPSSMPTARQSAALPMMTFRA